MPSTYTVNLGIEKPATGEQSGTWGDTTNVNFDILDQAINGAERVTLTSAGSSGSPNALNITNGATSDGRNKWIEFYSSGDLGGSVYVQLVPNDAEKIVFVRNSLASSRSILLFQGTYNSGRDLEIPAGVDMVVKFDGGGASAATVTDVFTKLRATEITTPTLTATTADINGGTIDNSVIGGSTAAAVTGTAVVANTSLNIAGDGATVTGIKDEDNMASNSATKLATQQSIKAYVDSQVGTVDTWAEVLANGATSGSTNPEVTAGQALKTNTINETSAGSGVTIDSVLLKDDVVNATDVETASISANDGTPSATIANSTGNFTITNFLSNSVDIGGGAIDGTVIGGASAAAGSFTTGSFSGLATFNADINITDANPQITLSDTSQTNLTHTIVSGSDNLVITADSQDVDSGSRITLGVGTVSNARFTKSETVFNEGSADLDFRVESDSNTNALFVKGSTSRVGINEPSPDNALHVKSGSDNLVLKLESTDTEAGIEFRDTTGAAYLKSRADFRFEVNSADVVKMFANETIVNDAGADYDFRVESNNKAYMFYIDGGNDAAFFGGSDKRGFVNIETTAVNYSSGVFDNPHIALQASAQPDDNDGFVGITYATSDSDNYGWSAGAERTSSGVGDFVFTEHNNSATGSEKLRITQSGSVTFSSSITIPDWVYHSGDSNTYFGFPSGDEFKVVTANVGRLHIKGSGTIFNEGGVDVDFRVESDGNANMLFVDGGNNRVHFGSSANIENNRVQVTGPKTLVGGIPQQSLGVNDSTAMAEGVGGSIDFTGEYLDNGTYTSFASVEAYKTNGTSGNYDGTLVLKARQHGGDQVDKLRLNSTEAVFNEDGLDTDFRVESDAKDHAFFLQGSSSKIGINQSNPAAMLDIVTVSTAGADAIRLRQPSSSETYQLQMGVSGATNEGLVLRNTASTGILQQWRANEVVINEDGVDRDFRVESDAESHAIFVDAGNDRLGLFASSPTAGYKVSIGGGALNVIDDNAINRITSTAGYTVSTGGTGNIFRLATMSAHGARARARAIGSVGYGDPVVHEFIIEMAVGNADDEFGVNVYRTGDPINQHRFKQTNAEFDVYTDKVNNSSFDVWVKMGHFCRLEFFLEEESGTTARFDNSGTATLPGTAVDTNTKSEYLMFADDVRITTQNTAQTDLKQNVNFNFDGVVFNEDSVDLDFRVESDTNTHALFVDAGSNAVGIGTSAPNAPLHVQTSHTETNVTQANANDTLNIANNGTGNGVFNAIKFSGNQQDMYMLSVNNSTQRDRRIGFFVGSVAGDSTGDEHLAIKGKGAIVTSADNAVSRVTLAGSKAGVSDNVATSFVKLIANTSEVHGHLVLKYNLESPGQNIGVGMKTFRVFWNGGTMLLDAISSDTYVYNPTITATGSGAEVTLIVTMNVATSTYDFEYSLEFLSHNTNVAVANIEEV